MAGDFLPIKNKLSLIVLFNTKKLTVNYILSNHVKQRAEERGISTEIIDQIMNSPQQIVDEEEPGQKVYQSLIAFSEKKTYLVRVFVNTAEEPSVVKSVYRTSKVDKYYEGEI